MKVKAVETKVKQIDGEILERNEVLVGVSLEYSTYWELEKFCFNFIKENLEPSIDVTDSDFVRRLRKISNKR